MMSSEGVPDDIYNPYSHSPVPAGWTPGQGVKGPSDPCHINPSSCIDPSVYPSKNTVVISDPNNTNNSGSIHLPSIGDPVFTGTTDWSAKSPAHTNLSYSNTL